MRIGLDIHGVIDAHPDFFKYRTMEWMFQGGHEIHIVTGMEWGKAMFDIYQAGISFTHHFSIVDHHRRIGTRIWNNDTRGDGYWMDKEDWNRTKGEYAVTKSLDIHIDDSPCYGPYFPKSCKFVLASSPEYVEFIASGDLQKLLTP